MIDVGENCALETCTHIALLGTRTRICNDNLIKVIVDRFRVNLKQARIKDLERIAFVLSKFDFKSNSGAEDELCCEILQELKLPEREPAIAMFPQVFAKCAEYLAHRGAHCPHLLSCILSPDFLKTTYGAPSEYGQEIFFLDSYVKINLGNAYDGFQLSDDDRAVMASQLAKSVISNDDGRRIYVSDVTLSVSEAVREVFGEPQVINILPHFCEPGWCLEEKFANN